MKLLLIVPDGVGIRNYLYSSFVDELNKNKIDVIVYHQLSQSAIDEIKSVNNNLTFKRIPIFKESLISRVLRECLAYGRLIRFSKKLNNKTILSFWNNKKSGFKLYLLYTFIELIGKLLSNSEKLILFFDKLYEISIKKSKSIKPVEEDLIDVNPSIVLNLHQRSPLASPIITAAKKLDIKTASVIFSWDNIPKARLISRYDDYFVWSNIMKNQLCFLYPEIKSESIKVVGTPQFEFYFQEGFYKTKEAFFKSFGLDINKKTICYSANDESLPYDPIYLGDICEELMTLRDEERPQILFRICPVDKSNRFDKVIEKYKSIIFPITPDWRTDDQQKSFTSIYPTYKDIELLVNTVRHSDFVINLGSTMAHDFSILNKPCLYLNYNPVSNHIVDVETIYKFEHFKSIQDLKPVGWINGKDDIISKITNTLKKPSKVGVDKKEWFNKIVEFTQTSSKEIVKYISNT